MMKKFSPFLFLLALLFFAVAGCSSNGTAPTAPVIPQDSTAAIEPAAEGPGVGSVHHPLGFFACTADPVAGTLEIEPIRLGEFHLNALFYLQGGPQQLLTIEGIPQFSDGGKMLDVDIGIKHPINNPAFTGFDVRAVFISEGSVDGLADSTVKIAGPDETRLVNPDGYTRWWNPKEFTHTGLYGYLPGELGMYMNPNKTAVLNGFKYFADGLGPDDDFSTLDTDLRGMLSTGTKLVRHFKISLKGGLKFNYAVDASWALPTENPPTPPDDFPLDANQLEPYRIEVEEWVNTLWFEGGNSGGNVFYRITAYDWQGVQTMGGGFIEVPNLGIENALNDILEVGDNYITWGFRAFAPKIKKAGPADLLVTVYSPEGDYQPELTGVTKFFRAYTLHVTDVSDVQPDPIPPVAIAVAETSTEIVKHESVTFNAEDSYDPDGTDITFEWDFNADGIYGDEYESGTDENPTAVFHAGGEFDVDVRVTDLDMLEGFLDVKIHVTVSNQPPIAHAEMSGEEPYYAGAWYTFDASGSTDIDGEVSVYEWDFDYDGETFDIDESGVVVKYGFEISTYDIMLRVYDDDCAVDCLDEPITRSFEYKENFPPEIDSVESDRTTVLKNSDDEKVVLTVYFSDIDVDDEHTVEWIADGGEFTVIDDQQFQQTVEWKAIDEVGHFYITVRVYDLFSEFDENSDTMVRVTQYPTGAAPYGYNVSEPGPGWELPDVPDQDMFYSTDYSPGKVVLIHFWKFNC